ncbi:hypothetical protein HHK36_003031 [Tetracentron sinense]|uniref:Pentatricopeptide repeat-containing protein n=1 Tax=Tetracentron sinense TaxID=13715 RepID=A0A834ZNK3_TETSI|nr:hypothetical protein HHK36_003031 [Tetracentron sinense]
MEIEGLQPNPVTWTSLLSAYAQCGQHAEALWWFGEMRMRSVGATAEAVTVILSLEKSKEYPMVRPDEISWSAVISGVASMGRGEESLELFCRMQQVRVMTNSVTISSVLSVCAELAALGLGREIHGHVITNQRNEDRDLISWNSMIAGYGMHGLGENSLITFDEWVKAGCEYVITSVAVVTRVAGCLIR